MARFVYIVSRRHPKLFEYLLQRFSDDPNVQVILDRRRAERRQAEAPVRFERRRVDRRQQRDLSQELRGRSVAVVTIP
jgi:hypothetical protein